MKKYDRYTSREEAGKILAEEIAKLNLETPYLLAIPRGGIQVAEGISKKLKIPINPIITKKLPIPGSPETGFGAITEDGTKVYNENYLAYLDLTEEELDAIYAKVIKEIKHRISIYGTYDKNIINKSDVIVVDDGAATGYSIIAALKSVKVNNPKTLIAAIPVSSFEAYNKIKELTDHTICPLVVQGAFFAVGNYYDEWYDLSEEQILNILNEHRKFSK